jgi:hypothetical protein
LNSEHIALNHETKADTAKTVIPQVVKDLKNKGYKLVTVSECLGIPAYQSVGQPKKRDVSSFSVSFQPLSLTP